MAEDERNEVEVRASASAGGDPPPAGEAVVEAGGLTGPLAVAANVADYVFYLLYGFLAIRLVLAFLGAREGAAFVRLVHGITEPFYAPFRGIVARPGLDGGYLDLPAVLALLAYVLLHVAVRGLLRVIAGRPPAR